MHTEEECNNILLLEIYEEINVSSKKTLTCLAERGGENKRKPMHIAVLKHKHQHCTQSERETERAAALLYDNPTHTSSAKRFDPTQVPALSEHAQTAYPPHSSILYDKHMNTSEVFMHCRGEADEEEAEDKEEKSSEEEWS